MKVIIVEDEAIAARRLSRMLSSRDLEIVKVITSVQDLKVQLQSANQPELYFFDIHLNDGIVFDAFENIQLNTPIIFTTAYDQYAIKAFKQNSIDYLLKPIADEDLDGALEKFKRINSKSNDLSSLSSLLTKLSVAPEKKYRERISIKIGDKLRSVNIEDILFFYSDNKINFLFTKEGRAYPIDFSIEEIFSQLDPSQFYRVNRGYILRISAIQEVISYSNSRLKVKVEAAPNHEIIVSREKVKDFKNWLG